MDELPPAPQPATTPISTSRRAAQPSAANRREGGRSTPATFNPQFSPWTRSTMIRPAMIAKNAKPAGKNSIGSRLLGSRVPRETPAAVPAEVATLTFKAAISLPPIVAVVGATVQVEFAGAPAQVRATLPLKPLAASACSA